MKKSLFIAFALVASVLAFNSCNGNKQNNPSDPKDGDKQGQDSTAIEPAKVTAQDLIGEWRMDSTVLEGQIDRDGRYILQVTPQTMVLNYDTCVSYKVENGILTVVKNEYDYQTGMTNEVEHQLEIVSFNKGVRAVFVEHNALGYDYQTGDSLIGDKYFYVGAIPEPTGADVAVTEENLKGAWLVEYEIYNGTGQPMGDKSCSPHWIFYVYMDNHDFNELLVADYKTGDIYPHPGYWWYQDGKVAFGSQYGPVEDFDINTIGDAAWYTVEVLKEDFMVLHAQWSDEYGTGNQYYYLSRQTPPELPNE